MLLDDFKDRKGITYYHMLHKSNEAQDRVMFLYKFVKGACQSSFGMNVARMAGLPPSILTKAKIKSGQFTRNLDEITKKIKEKKEMSV